MANKNATPLARALMRWFQRDPRPLPWRQRRTPYRVWISEVMLQQTRVETVIPYYQRFMRKWPTINDLAHAEEDEVLRAWEGLGYYSRARNLKKAAQMVLRDHGGDFPEIFEDIQELPGIGVYTAGAISSLAFGNPHPAIDGNVVRVFSRLNAKRSNVSAQANHKTIERLLLPHIPSETPGIFNEALMELGATVCTPRNPLCKECPLQNFCKAFAQGKPQDYPARKKQLKVRREIRAVAIVRQGKKVLLEKKSDKGLLGGLWEFPTFTISKNLKKRTTLQNNFSKAFAKRFTWTIFIQEQADAYFHKFSHIHMTYLPFFCELKKPPKITKNEEGLIWIPIAKLQTKALAKPYRYMADFL